MPATRQMLQCGLNRSQHGSFPSQTNWLTNAIPKMSEMATNADLKAGLKLHVVDTQNQIERLKVFAKLGQQPNGTDCPAIEGLIKEADATAARSKTRLSWTRPLSPIPRPSSIMRFPATAP